MNTIFDLKVSGLAMSVSCGLTEDSEAWLAAMESQQKLESLVTESERNTELAALYLEARRKLEELKTQLKSQDKKDQTHNVGATNDLKLPTVEGLRNICISCFTETLLQTRETLRPSLPRSGRFLTGRSPSPPPQRPSLVAMEVFQAVRPVLTTRARTSLSSPGW